MANNNHFNLTLDTTKPTGGISCDVRYTNKVEALAITYNEDAAYMKVWFDAVEAPVAASGEWEVLATSKQTAFADEGTYYYHVQFIDSIGNESDIYTTGSIVYDKTPAEIEKFVIADPQGSTALANELEIDYTFNIKDNSVSGIKSAVISGACTTVTVNTPAVGQDVTGKVTLNSGDGAKELTLTVTDYAGNVTTAQASITLDMTLDAAIILAYRTAEGESNAISQYSNVSKVLVKLGSLDSGTAGYKIWYTGETEPAQFETDDLYAKEFTLADGAYTMNAKIIDQAGNIQTSTVKQFTVDTVNPVGTVEVNKTQISNVEGFNEVQITATANDAGVGIKDKYITVNGAKQEATFDDTGKAIINITSAQASVEGENVIAVYAQDKAMAEANVAAVKVAETKVVLDTTAPTGSFGTPNTWYKEQGNVKLAITHSDGTGVGVEKLYVWVDNNATATTAPTNVTATVAQASGSVYVPDYTSLVQGDNYIHAVIVDKVGNSTVINSAKFGYDNVAPAKPTISFDKAIYSSVSANVSISATDATSKVNLMWVEGDITNPTATEGEKYSTTRAVTLKAGDGAKKVRVKVIDNAGNESEYSVEASTVLDTTAPAATIALVKRGTTEALGNFSAVAEFDAQISGLDDAGAEGKAQYYQVYGPGINVEYDENAFVELVYDEGKTYKTVQLTATANAESSTSGETKEIYVKVKDDAGNISPEAHASFVYDPSAAVIAVKDVSDNIISCVHELRRTGVATTNEKYCDEVSFKFTPDSNIVEYKVCVFASQEEAANAGDPEALSAIAMNSGSKNLSGSGINSATEVSCLIKGDDFKAHVGKDGAYVVVVYAKNEAGVWSEAAKF